MGRDAFKHQFICALGRAALLGERQRTLRCNGEIAITVQMRKYRDEHRVRERLGLVAICQVSGRQRGGRHGFGSVCERESEQARNARTCARLVALLFSAPSSVGQ